MGSRDSNGDGDSTGVTTKGPDWHARICGGKEMSALRNQANHGKMEV